MAESANVLQTKDSSFEQDVLKSNEVAIVDFWAEWCAPCRLLGPTIDAIADDFAGKAKVYKMNVDENPDTPAKFSIRAIPTILVFKGGEVVEQLQGNQPKDEIAAVIQKHS